MDQVICASLSHTHYWYEVGMLKVPAKYTILINALGESFILSVVQSLYIIPSEKRFSPKHTVNKHLSNIVYISSFNGAPFSYRNRTPHSYEIFLLRFVIWLLRALNIGSSAPDWPGTVQKHSDTSTTLKK